MPSLRLLGLVAGPILALVVFVLLPSSPGEAVAGAVGLALPARLVAGVATLMAVWWVTEALPIEATGLVPLALFPLFNIAPVAQAAAPYANEVIFLFLGGLLLGRAMEVWGLHERLALGVLGSSGGRPTTLVLGFLASTAFISMWVSNTAAAILLFPVGVSVVNLVRAQAAREHAGRRAFEPAVMLAIAYGASIGGVATLIGTPPIAQLAAFMSTHTGTRLSFARWLGVGLPIAIVGIALAWVVLAFVAFRVPHKPVPGLHEAVRARRESVGPWTSPQRRVAIVGALAALLWVVVPIAAASGAAGALQGLLDRAADSVVAILCALALFVIPAGGHARRPLLTWPEAQGVPWGVLVLFGGGLSLADAARRTGLDAWIAQSGSGLGSLHPLVLILIVTIACQALSEMMSNTALTALALPVASALAERCAIPATPILYAVALGSSLAFALPVGTPPNALVFASGHIRAAQMFRAGAMLDGVFAAVVALAIYGAWKLGLIPGA